MVIRVGSSSPSAEPAPQELPIDSVGTIDQPRRSDRQPVLYFDYVQGQSSKPLDIVVRITFSSW
jgi:hypothetical protein